MDTNWRLIESGPCDAFYNMALDEAIATEVRRGSAPPTLRMYGWNRPSLTLGCFQKVSDINIEYCQSQGIPVVRRPTGGRAILHGDELTYSLSAGTDRGPFSHGLLDSYRRISIAFSIAFKKVGVTAGPKNEREKGRVLSRSPLCFQSSSYGEILTEDKKLVGSAQKRWTNGLLQQGSVPYISQEEKLAGIFGEEKTVALRDCMKALKDILPLLDEDAFRKAVASSFEEAFDIRLLLSAPSQEESLLAEELLHRKYLRDRWNLRQLP
jgi:lipoyl(octanoyl) transferase